MKVVSELLSDKGDAIWAVSPDDSVYDALKVLADKEIGAVLVLEEGELVGIMSERDYARKIVLRGRLSRVTPVRDIMTRDVICVSPEHQIEECMALMTEKRVRHLPVLDGDDLVGMISIGDVVRAIIADREFVIAQLERYITGRN